MNSQTPFSNPLAQLFALADQLGEHGVFIALLLALTALPHPAFVLAVNGRRQGHFRTVPILWGVAGSVAIIIVLTQFAAGLLLSPALYLLWAVSYGPVGTLDAVSRGMLLVLGRRASLRGRPTVRWVIDGLTLWPAWVIGLASLAEGAWLGGTGTLAGILGAAGCAGLTAGRPFRRYVSEQITRVGGVNTVLWTVSAVLCALGVALLILALSAMFVLPPSSTSTTTSTLGIFGVSLWTLVWTIIERQLAGKIATARASEVRHSADNTVSDNTSV